MTIKYIISSVYNSKAFKKYNMKNNWKYWQFGGLHYCGEMEYWQNLCKIRREYFKMLRG